ncbi:MAG: hypothetical protein RR942_06045 [Romboutsia sp.]
MSIKRDAMKIVKAANEICKERNLDIKKIIEEDDEEFNNIWTEAVEKVEKRKIKTREVKGCNRCKRTEANITDIEVLLKQKKYDWEGKGDLMKEGVIIGLEMALTMLK